MSECIKPIYRVSYTGNAVDWHAPICYAKIFKLATRYIAHKVWKNKKKFILNFNRFDTHFMFILYNNYTLYTHGKNFHLLNFSLSLYSLFFLFPVDVFTHVQIPLLAGLYDLHQPPVTQIVTSIVLIELFFDWRAKLSRQRYANNMVRYTLIS